MNPLELPKLTKYINDFSNVLSPEQVESLSQTFINHESTTTEQVVTVFIPHRQWNELLDIGLKVFNENGIGQKNLNNWLLLIIATEEKKLRIIVWKWLELKYTEMVCRDILENHLRPLLNEGKYEEIIKEWKEIITEKIILTHEGDTWNLNQNSENLLRSKFIKKTIVFTWFWTLMFSIIFFQNYSMLIIWIILTLIWIWIVTKWLMWLIWSIQWFISWIYNFTKDKTVLTVTPMLFLILGIWSLFIYFWARITYCQFYTSASCIEITTSYDSSSSSKWSKYKSSSSSSDYSSSDSSSSSFDWGGGSSNGGGYWD